MFFSKQKKPFSPEEESRLLSAIERAEKQTSGEIKVHIDKVCKENVIDFCKNKFHELKMHETQNRNGILLYLAIDTKVFAVWGDEGIHQKVQTNFWDNITNTAISEFKLGSIINGLEKAIELCGSQLQEHFPYAKDDKNELSNEISF